MKNPPWLLVPPGSIRTGAVVTLDPAEAHHATGPLRLRSGDDVVITDGEGTTATARLAIAEKARAHVEVMSCRVAPGPTGNGVILVLAVIESKAMDWAVQKSVEIGVRILQPVVTERTQGRFVKNDRSTHWRRVARQALKQCHRPWAMEVCAARPLADVVADHPAGGFVADPGGLSLGVLRRGRDRVLAVGPEGGFSASEQEIFEDLHWCRLKLGKHILRSETAAIVGGAMLIAHDEEPNGIEGRISR